MKKQTFIVIAAVLLIVSVVCYNLIVEHKQKNKQMQAVKQIEESMQTTKQEDKYSKEEEISSDKKNWDEMTAEEQEAIRNKYLSKFNFNKKYTLKTIDDELATLFNALYGGIVYDNYLGICDFGDASFKADVINPLLCERLELHLQNPITFRNNLSATDSFMSILKTPDGKYKFYSFDDGLGGTHRFYINYVQYKNKSDKVVCRRLDDDLLCVALWQFTHKDKTYYVTKSYDQQWTCGFGFNLDIFTLLDGVQTFHTEFGGGGVFTSDCNDVDIDFNSRTKTVFVTDYQKNDSFEFEQIKRTYRLVEPK